MQDFKSGINKETKVMYAEASGSFSPEAARETLKQYHENVSQINPAEYTLSIDCSKLNVFSPDVAPILEQCFMLYKQTGFKKIKFTISNSNVLKNQFVRIAKKAGLDNYEIVEV